ncbi:MAG: hypothetical protein QOE15_643, partial [Acidimicrobiaceae bacterium]|nr:hypothetical protein [Acidimicrobiaceae bacterium]
CARVERHELVDVVFEGIQMIRNATKGGGTPPFVVSCWQCHAWIGVRSAAVLQIRWLRHR